MNYLKTFLPYIFGNKKGKSFVFPEALNWSSLNFEETLMFHTLQNTIQEFTSSLSIPELSSQQIYHLFSFEDYLPVDFLTSLKKCYPKQYEIFSMAIAGEGLSAKSLQELLNYKNYKLSLFAILNKDRTKPGKLFIRRADGRFVLKDNGQLWSMRVLGTSSRGLSFNHSNGSTPCGVYSVESVMPEANKYFEFGKFRRLIVNFMVCSPGEENIKQFLPPSHRSRSWWLPSVVGREQGRSLLRIHGTGGVNKNPLSPYFPMIPSSGCLTTTENLFGLIPINHQRQLLDTLMAAMGIPATYENESKIHGVLYVVEFDDTYQALEFKS